MCALDEGDPTPVYAAHVRSDGRCYVEWNGPDYAQGDDMSTFIFDLDGTIYLEDDLIPGARDTLDALTADGHQVLFASNNTALTPAAYARKLAAFGIAVAPDGLVTASGQTIAYLQTLTPVRTVIVLGPAALTEEVEAAGFVLRHDTAQPVDAVVVGHDDAFSYERLRLAHAAVVAGARLIATDGDRHVPRRAGLWPGTASITAAIEMACGNSATVIGKPAGGMLRTLMASVGAEAATTVVVGDSIATDIAGAAALGLYSVYVLSGIARFQPEALTPSPSLMLPSVAALIPALHHARPDLMKC